MVRSFAKPSSLSTQRSKSSLFLDLEEVLGAMCWASEIVTTLSKSSWGLPSAAHNILALFSYITCNRTVESLVLFSFWSKKDKLTLVNLLSFDQSPCQRDCQGSNLTIEFYIYLHLYLLFFPNFKESFPEWIPFCVCQLKRTSKNKTRRKPINE